MSEKIIITRKQALESKALRFYTGKPCGKGHTAERYVKGGACTACMGRPESPRVPADNSLRRQQLELQERKAEIREREAEMKAVGISQRAILEGIGEAKQHLIKFKTLCPHSQAGKLRAAAHMFAAARDPRLRFKDVAVPHLTPRSMGMNVGLYTLACFPDDHPALVDIAKSLMRPMQLTHSEVEANRQAVLSSAIATANAGDDSWPEGDPR